MLTVAANHLWQSTIFAGAAALLALALRGNHARVRYWLWLAASVKFLVPFSVLSRISGSLARMFLPAAPGSPVPLAMDRMVQTFAPVGGAALPAGRIVQAASKPDLPAQLLPAVWLCGFLAVVIYGWMRWRRVAEVIRCSTPITEGRELDALLRIIWSGRSLPGLVSSTAQLEPGAFGIFRQSIWLPAGIADRLDDGELEAILTHELCHIRRRDNLAALVHMAVEALFWFHPMVWWLGGRLTEERERACDEEVVRMGGEPRVYAESILKVCEFYLASPVACAAGVTGGQLKGRIESIIANRFGRSLSWGKKLMLAVAAAAAVAGPFAFGIMSARAQTPPGDVPRFDVASVRVVHDGMGGAWDEFPINGTWTSKSIGIPAMVAYAYGVSFNRVEGIPKEFRGPDPGFTIVAKMPVTTNRKDFFLMLQSLLADRFKAAIHTEVREVAANTIEVAKGGVKLQRASGQCVEIQGNESLPRDQHRCHDIQIRVAGAADRSVTWNYSGWSVTMADLAALLSSRVGNGLVVDDTGLSGLYDFDVKIVSHPGQDELDSQNVWNQDWRDAWEKEAGLAIDLAKTKKRPGMVVVVDHVEMPTPN